MAAAAVVEEGVVAVLEAGVIHDLRAGVRARLRVDPQVLGLQVLVLHPLHVLLVRAVPVIQVHAPRPRAGALRPVGFLHLHIHGQVHPNGPVPA